MRHLRPEEAFDSGVVGHLPDDHRGLFVPDNNTFRCGASGALGHKRAVLPIAFRDLTGGVGHGAFALPAAGAELAGVDVAVGPGVGAGAAEQVVEDLAAISMG